MIVNYDGPVCGELLDRLVDAYNNVMDGEKVYIYFNSGGGDTETGNVIIDLINKDPDAFHITAFGCIASAAFNIFFSVKCSRELLAGTTGMIHKSYYFDMPITVDLKILHREKEIAAWRQAKLDSKLVVPFLTKTGLSSSELEEFKEGKDVWFMHKRMKEFLNKQKTNGKIKTGSRKRAA
jgi:ATP-dependent protease ClpP protease subunit